MIRIPLRARDGSVRAYALIDDEDAHLAAFAWRCHGSYAARSPGTVLLHREVLGLVPGDGLQGDHINGDKLDCRRTNLRVGTQALNGQNILRTSRYRGVTFEAGRWRARATLGGRNKHLGRFNTEQEAAVAAAAFRAQHMPFANEERITCPSPT